MKANSFYISYAIESIVPLRISTLPGEFIILYCGSIDFTLQSLEKLRSFLVKAQRLLKGIGLRFQFAGREITFLKLKKKLSLEVSCEYLGWLDKKSLQFYISHADALLLLPWTTPGRKWIPSKFYEYLKSAVK